MMKKKLWISALMFTAISFPAYSFNYEQCSAAAKDDWGYAACMKTESNRLINLIKAEYDAIGKDSRFTVWNKGKSQNSDNLRKLFNDWLSYRDNYCSLYTLSMSNYIGIDEYNRQKCIYDITNQQYNDIKSIIQNADSDVVGN
ncbi:MAG: lysozyme inhibitor LprI family protein [Alphaproteobacteria bacterium]